MTLRLGLLSTATINDKLLAGARAAAGVDVVAVASRDAARAESWAREHGIGRAHGSYEALLADPGVDAVYISLPNSLHVPWSLRALEAGKHVLCEKPLTRRPTEAREVFDAAERARLVLAEAFMYRHHPQTGRLLELVRGGAVGEPRLVRAAFSYMIGSGYNVRLDADLDGGALMDVGCYGVHAARQLLGEPERVCGEQVERGGVDVRFAAVLRFPEARLALVDCGFDLTTRDELEVIGEDGSLFVDDPWHCVTPGIQLRRRDGAERIEVPAMNPYAAELEDLARAVRGEAEPLIGRDDAVAQAQALEALYTTAAPVS